jgi:hypothetical protein
MAGGEFLEIDPAKLHLPGGRQSGADFLKLQRQFSRYGTSTKGMPPLTVARGSDGELVIYDGVTRATRISRYAPDIRVIVEVIEDLAAPVGNLPTVRETR